ncbi:MAG: zinc ABC transporter substrate-binding protein [Clostridia bacterium]|nr:zinc ABC transporter substrate-binding protein [Clostridia bacterium]
MKKLFALLAALMLCVTPLAALAETVVTSFYPIYLFARNLTEGVEGVTVRNLAPQGTGCLHDYQLQTGDMKALATADVFLINGAGMEGYLSHVTGAFPALPVVDASAGVTLLGEDDLPVCVSGEEHDHAHDHEHAVNAHVWLDVQNAILMVNNLCEGLAQAMPDRREAFEANRDAYVARLTALDAELRAGLAELPRRDVVTFHEAFPYFARAYGLNVAAVVNQEPGDALSPAALSGLIRLVQQLGTPPLFTEPQYEDIAAQTIARETGAKVFQLDPIVTGPEDDAALTCYEDTMRRNMQVLLEALGD